MQHLRVADDADPHFRLQLVSLFRQTVQHALDFLASHFDHARLNRLSGDVYAKDKARWVRQLLVLAVVGGGHVLVATAAELGSLAFVDSEAVVVQVLHVLLGDVGGHSAEGAGHFAAAIDELELGADVGFATHAADGAAGVLDFE